MFETAGTLTIVEIASSLVALVLLPLLFAAVATVATVQRTSGRFAMRVAIATSGGTFGLAIAHAVRAAQTPPGRIAQQHVVQLARIGQLDLGIDLVRDPTSATFAVLASFLGFAAVLHAVWTGGPRIAGRLAWTGLATSATLLVVLADDLPTLAVGLQLATLAAWALAGGGRPRALGLALAGDMSVVFAAWILFWSLGGTFGASGFTPDPLPRFALVALPDAPREDGKAAVTLTTYEDSLVSSDEGTPLPGEPLRAPFAVTLEPGTYSFRIQAGAGTADLLVSHVTLAAGRSYALSPYGPTTSLLNLEDQLAVSRPAPAGPVSVRGLLASRTLAGLHVPTILGFVTVLAALLRLAVLARSDRGGLAYALEGIAPVVLVLHIVPLLDPSIATFLAALPAAAAVVLAASAAATRSRDRVPRAALGVLTAIALSAALLGESAGAVVIVVAATLGAAAATAALDAEADVRWLGVACACLAGVLPAGGASPGLASALAGALSAGTLGSSAALAVGPLVVLALILLSLALFRVYSASIGMGPRREASRAPAAHGSRGARGSRVLVVVLAAFSLLGGAALGTGTSLFGGRTEPLARRLVSDAGGVDNAPRIIGAALGVSVLAAVLGLIAARTASRTADLPGWVRVLDGPAALVARVTGLCESLVRFFVRSVKVMNEDVIDDATDVLAGAVAAVGGGVSAIDAKLAGGRVARLLGRGADEVVVRTGMDDPQRFSRFRFGLVLGMVAVLGLVVLSSVVLG